MVVFRLTRHAPGARLAQTQTCGTTTGELLRRSDWLGEGGGPQVGLESTGEVCKPVFTLREGTYEVWLLNAQHIKVFTTDSPHWKHSGLDRHGRGDRSDPCFVRPAIAVA